MRDGMFSSYTDQVTDLMRQGLIEGRWQDTLPGRHRLADELGCSDWTIEMAIRRLTKEGLLISEGAGRRRRIELPLDMAQAKALRVMILMYEENDRKTDYFAEIVHRLQQAGHEASFAKKTLRDMRMDIRRITGFVGGTKADAWVVIAGSREVLEWFSQQETPAFAVFGRLTQVNLASSSPRKSDALVELVDRLVDLGHHRIVMLVREERRKPDPGFTERMFLSRLKERGIKTGAYNLPDWGDWPAEFRRILDSLFVRAAPTALIISEPALYFAAMQHLASQGIVAPRDVSLACTDSDPAFEWCYPAITRITWDSRPVINSVVKWANRVSRGEDDRKKTATKAKLIPGGTIGPVPKDKAG